MAKREALEARIAAGNIGFFLQEFSFSRAEFTPAGKSEIELADHLVVFDEFTLAYQLKERTEPTTSAESETSWYENKVLKKATGQIRETVALLREHDISLANDRGHKVTLKKGAAERFLLKVVLFSPGDALPLELRFKKGHVSRTAGFVHLIPAPEYLATLNTLVTVPEIIDYLRFREQIATSHGSEADRVPEKALVGQYLAGEEGVPSNRFVEHVDRLEQNYDEFDISGILHKFHEKTLYSEAYGVPVAQPAHHYAVVSELARLSRNDLAGFKQRFMLSWNNCSGDHVAPYIMASKTTGCGFVFIPVPKERESKFQQGLMSLTTIGKYLLHVDRCVGVAFRRDGEHRLLDWAVMLHPWRQDAELDALLAERSPFRAVSVKAVPKYTFR